MMKQTRWLHALACGLAFMVLLAMAPPGFAIKVNQGGGADTEVQDRIEDAKNELPGGGKPPSGSSSTATIRGSVFYNDQRDEDGLWADRRYPDGSTGRQCNPAVNLPDCSATEQRLAELRAESAQLTEGIELLQGKALGIVEQRLAGIDSQIAAEQRNLAQCKARCGLNWLGGRYMVVDVIERDDGFAITDTNCKREQVVASATVGRDGSFVATFPTADACNHDELGSAVELRVRLRFCNANYCFSINKDNNDPYALSHPGASATNPLKVKAGDDISVNRLNFNTGADPLTPNDYSIAANYYASIVDTIITLHRDNPIPFFRQEFDELQYIFPSNKSGSATARSPTEVAISTFQSKPPELNGAYAWIGGKTPAHEYGHVMMQRAWGGSYGFDGVGNGDPEPETAAAPSVQIAFKEAWAEFIARVVFEPTRGCSRPGFDLNGKAGCSDIAQRLAGLRAEHTRKLDELEDLQGLDAKLALQQVASLEQQIAAEERNLADCRAAGGRTDLSAATEAEEGANLKGPLGAGAQWRDNVVKALCDWYDAKVDEDPYLAGPGDHFSAEDIHSMWQNLRGMYTDAAKYGGEYKKPGLWFCDYVRYYLDVRKSADAVGAASHASYEDSIRDLIYNNNIACSMPAPN